MNRSTDRPPPTQAQARLIAIAILLGGFAFAVVVPIILSQSDGKGLADPPVTILTWIAAGFALVAAAAGFGLRSAMLQRAENATGDARQTGRVQATILGLAMLEGGILFNCVVWLLNGTAVPNAIAAGLLLALGLLMVPSGEAE